MKKRHHQDREESRRMEMLGSKTTNKKRVQEARRGKGSRERKEKKSSNMNG